MIRMTIVWSALGKSTLLLPSRTLSVSTTNHVRSVCSARGSLSLRRGRSLRPHDHSSLSRSPKIALSPPSLLKRTPAILQSEAKDAGSLASGEIETECAASERSTLDDKAFEELLEVVTNADARLKLDWPQEQEKTWHSKLEDRFLSGGQTERSQRRSLPFSPLISMTSYIIHGVSRIPLASLYPQR